MPTPIRYSEAPTQYLLSLQKQRRQEQLLSKKAELENQKASAAIPFDFARQAKTLDRLVVDSKGKENIQFLQSAIASGAPLPEVRRMAGEMMMEMSSMSSAIKDFRDNGEQYIEKISPSMGIDKGRASQIMSGYLMLNYQDPEKLKDPVSFINDAIKKSPDLFVDYRLGANRFTEVLKSAPKYSVAQSISQNPTGLKKEQLDWRASQPFFYDFETVKDKKTGNTYEKPRLKVGKDGLVTDDVFNYFYNNAQNELDFRMKSWVDANAKKAIAMENYGKSKDSKDFVDIDDEATLDLYRKSFLTDILKGMNVSQFKLGVSSAVAKPAQKKSASAGSKKSKTTSGIKWQ